MPVAAFPAEQRVLLSDVSWDVFLELVNNPGALRGRLAYDQGVLEIMSPSGAHEKIKGLIGRFIETMSLILGLDISSYGSTTLLRVGERRGLEPDECYYVQSEPAVRGKGDIDLAVDPPPDIVVEVDLSRSSLDKFRVYQSLGVPEIWRFDGLALTIHVLGPDGSYRPAERSAAFPLLPVEGFREFLGRWASTPENWLVRSFAAWVETWAHERGE